MPVLHADADFDVLARHTAARWGDDDAPSLDNPGYYRDLKRGGDYHTHNKQVVDSIQAMSAAHLLQNAIRSGRDDLYAQAGGASRSG